MARSKGYLKINATKKSFDYVTGEFIYEDVCPYFEATGFIRNINAKKDEFPKLKIAYNDHDKTQGEFIMDCSSLGDINVFDTLCNGKGLFVKAMHISAALELLQTQARELRWDATKTEYRHTKLGWHNIDGNDCFLYDDNTMVNGHRSICERDFQFTAGSREIYEQLLRETVFPSKELTLAYILGFSAVVVSRLDKIKIVELGTIVVNVSGKSSIGKSTIEQLMISPFGCPVFSKNCLGITHAGTCNGILDALEGIHGLPRVIDDLQQNSDIKLTELLYTISQQETKMRSGEKWNKNVDGWSGLLVASSEAPLMGMMKVQQGTYPRLLNLNDVQWTITAEQAEKVKKVVARNYGFTGREFIDYMSSMPVDLLANCYETALEKVKVLMTEKDGLTDRIATRIAAIALTCQLVKNCFHKPFKWTMEELVEPLIESEQDTVRERDPAEKLLDLLTTYVVENANQHFDTLEYKRGMGGEPIRRNATRSKYGIIEMEITGQWTVSFHQKALRDMLRKEGFNEWGTASKKLIEKGILLGTEEKKPNGKTTIRTRRKVGGVYCNVFVLQQMGKDLTQAYASEKPITPTVVEKVQEPPVIETTPVDTTVWNDQTLEEIFETDGGDNA